MHANHLFAAALTLFLSGCGLQMQRPSFHITTPFDTTAAARMMADGPNTIKGNAFMRQRGGAVVTCAGQHVTLIPATGYAITRFIALFGNKESAANMSRRDFTFIPDVPEYHIMVRTTKCDAQGNFIFERVADGDFYATVTVGWAAGDTAQGGHLMHKVRIAGGQTASVVMAP